MSISSMTSTRKWFIITGIVVVLGAGTLIFSRNTRPRDTLPLPGIWALIEEKIPTNHLLKRYRSLISWQVIEQKSSLDLTYTLHPSLFSTQYNTGEYLLSGIALLSYTTIYDITNEEGTLTGVTTIHLDGIKENGAISEVSEYEDTSFTDPVSNSFDATITWQAIIKQKNIYVYLDEVSFTSSEENGLTTLRQRYLLINQYKQKRVHFSRSDIPHISLFLPDLFIELLNNNDQKTRIVPDQNNGWLYLLSGNSLTLSGRASPTDSDALIATFPKAEVEITFEDSATPGIIDVKAKQLNEYQGVFEGDATLSHSFRNHRIDLSGEFQFPGGVWGEMTYLLFQKKGNLQGKDIELPKQFLERSTIYRNWMQVKNSPQETKK